MTEKNLNFLQKSADDVLPCAIRVPIRRKIQRRSPRFCPDACARLPPRYERRLDVLGLRPSKAVKSRQKRSENYLESAVAGSELVFAFDFCARSLVTESMRDNVSFATKFTAWLI